MKNCGTFLIVVLAAIGLVGYGATAIAQEQQEQQPPAAQKEKPAKEIKEEVVVTGTLIPRPTLEAMSPVSTLEVEDLSYRGITRLEDLLTSLPQVFTAQNSSISNGASGAATIDLRNLGSNRTLVLINGHRMQPGDTGNPAADLNFIPAMLVKRVDVLTGGASATYGADAVAGVVNFILDKDFEGIRAGISGGGFEHNNNNSQADAIQAARGFTSPKGQAWDGGQFDAYVALGGKFGEGKGSASAYIDYRQEAQLLKARRDYTNCSVSGLGATGPVCGGSSTAGTGRFTVYDPTFSSVVGNYTLDVTGSGNTFRNYTAADAFNYGPYNMSQRPDVRWAAGGFVDYEWNKHAHAYLETMFMNDHTDAQIAPSGDFYGNTTELNCDNPMMSAQQRNLICTSHGYGPTDIANVIIGRRSVESGGRSDSLDHEAYRLLGGIKGEINKAWTYDVYGLNAETRVAEIYNNDFNNDHIQEALLVAGDPNDPSTWHCTSGNSACVPWDIFKVGGVTQAAIDYLKIPLLSSGTARIQVASGQISGDLKDYGIAFPSASEGIQVAAGVSVSTFSMRQDYDLAYQTGLGAGQGSVQLPVSGQYRAKEGFVEAQIPIVQGARGAKDLSLNLGYRSSDYSTSGTFGTWKAEAAWAPSADFKLRAGKNRASRAPNVFELFTPQAVSLQGTTDPCSGTSPKYSQAQCAHTGVTAAQYGKLPDNPASQYYGKTGGNTDLQPEIADTVTFGLVLTPSAFAGFTAAFDYFDIKLNDAIGTLGFDDVLNECAVTGSPTLCNLIHRDKLGTLWIISPSTGQAGYVAMTNQNLNQLRRTGIDVNLTYVKPFSKSLITVNLIGSYLTKNELTTPLYSYDCAGYYGNSCSGLGPPSPKWRHMARIGWELGSTTLTLGWRFIGSVMHDANNPAPALSNPGNIKTLIANGANRIPSYSYFDLAGSYKIAQGVQFTVGVNNIADKEPPLGAGFSGNDNAAGFYGTYDALGRFIHSAITFTF